MEDPKIMKYFKEVETSNSMNDSNIQKKVNKDSASTIEIDSDLKIQKGALLIIEIGNKLCCPFPIIAKALLLYHRFMKVCPENKRKPDEIAAVEDLGKLNDIVNNMILAADVSTLSIT